MDDLTEMQKCAAELIMARIENTIRCARLAWSRGDGSAVALTLTQVKLDAEGVVTMLDPNGELL